MTGGYAVQIDGRLCAVCDSNCGPIVMLLYRPESDSWDVIGTRCSRVLLQTSVVGVRRMRPEELAEAGLAADPPEST